MFPIRCQVQEALKSQPSSSNQVKSLRTLDNKLQTKMTELGLTTADRKTLMKRRNKEILAKCLHKIGIVVPYDKETDVGYRPLPKTDSMFCGSITPSST